MKALCAFAGKSNTRLDPKKGWVRTCAKGVCGGMVAREMDCEPCTLHSVGPVLSAPSPVRSRRPLVLLPPIAACKNGGTDADVMERCEGCRAGSKHVRECTVHERCTHERVGNEVMDCRRCQLEGLGYEPAEEK